MHIGELIWDDWDVEHIADHGVEPEKVEDVCYDPYHWVERAGVTRYDLVRYRLYGQTNSGRYLFIIIDREYDDVFYVVTAREMANVEKHRFRRLRKR